MIDMSAHSKVRSNNEPDEKSGGVHYLPFNKNMSQANVNASLANNQSQMSYKLPSTVNRKLTHDSAEPDDKQEQSVNDEMYSPVKKTFTLEEEEP